MFFEKKKVEYQKDKNKSEFHNSFLEKEFIEIIKKEKIISNRLMINKNYIFENEETIEVGIYLSNLTKKNILVRDLPIELLSGNISLYSGIHKFEISIWGNSSVFFEMIIDKKNLSKELDNYSDVVINFDALNSIDINEYSYIDVKSVFLAKDYKATKDLRKYIKNLECLKKNQLGIDCYNLDLLEEYFEVVLVIRNTHDKDILLKSLPICISDSRDILIHKSIQKLEGCMLPKNSIKFIIINIRLEDIVITDNKFKDYKVDFQG